MKPSSRQYFEQTMLPHLSASYHFALSIIGHPQNAEDAVQEAYIRAFRAIKQFSGDNSEAWLMTIVRNVCMTQLSQSKDSKVVYIDSQMLKQVTHKYQIDQAEMATTPESKAIELSEVTSQSKRIHKAIAQLPVDYREVILLREFQDFNYQQISKITAVPMGTVMSRLSRARKELRKILSSIVIKEKRHEL